MPLRRMICPACGVELTYDPTRARASSGGKITCPYEGLVLGELRAGHDQIYFGRWRRMDATAVDVRKAYHQLGRHLSAIGQALAAEDLPEARRDLLRARELFRAADPRDETADTMRLMDNALSYAHRTIDAILHEKGLPSHGPMDFAEWYDAAEVPFRDEW